MTARFWESAVVTVSVNLCGEGSNIIALCRPLVAVDLTQWVGVSLHLMHSRPYCTVFWRIFTSVCVSVCVSLCTGVSIHATLSALSMGFTYYGGLVKTRSFLWLKNFLKCQKINHMMS